MKRKIRVLIVDDEPQNIQILLEILSFHPKYECCTAVSGEEALKKVHEYYPDIILLDLMMPGIDGYTVCREIRAMKTSKYSKILIISGKTLVSDKIQGYNVGADDYLTKPFVEDELIAKLEVYSKLSYMEEVDNLKTIALNILSHETRTPLNGIILGSELLREVSNLPQEAAEYAEMVYASGVRIKHLIEKINRYCQVKGGIFPQYEKIQLQTIFEKLTEIGNRRIDVELVLDCVNSVVNTDSDLLYEVTGYIVENAYKYNKKCGKILVMVRVDRNLLRIHIDDQGGGIEPDLRENLFDSLFSKDVLHHQEGTGLSLAIAKEIIATLGGRITCSENEDRGARFIIELPIN